VHRFLKKQEGDTELHILFSSRMADPMPAQYPIGQPILAFLKTFQGVDGKYYVTSGGHEGSIHKREALTATLPRVQELRELLPLKNDPEHIRKYRDWLMRCVENVYTRGDALHDLNYFEQSQYKNKEAFKPKLWKELTSGQLMILKDLIEESRLHPQSVSIHSERRDVVYMMQIIANHTDDKELIVLREKYLENVPRYYLPGHSDIPFSKVISSHQSLCKTFAERAEKLLRIESAQKEESTNE